MIPAVVLAALAFLLRVWVLVRVPLIETDGVRYVAIARQFQEAGSPFDQLFHPLYPMCIAAIQPLVGDWELAGRLVSAFFGAALVLPAWALARAVLGGPAALVSAALLAVHPGLVRNGAAVLTEATYTFVLVLGVWAAWRGLVTERRAWLPAAGLLFGLGYLARPESALYLVGLIALALIAARRSARPWRSALWAPVSLAAFLLPSGPYLLYLRGAVGYWTLSGKVAHNIGQDFGSAMTGGGSDVGRLVSQGGTLARRLLENGYLFEKYALSDLLPGVLALFLLPGLLARAREEGWLRREGFLLGAALPPFATLAFHLESRVFLPALPFVLPIAAAGILAAASWAARGRAAGSVAVAATLLSVMALLPYTLRPILRPDPGERIYREVARWVAATQPRDAVLMDRKPFVAFYSGRRSAPLGDVAPGALLAAAQRAGATLVILDGRVLEDRPRLVPLLWAPPPAGLAVERDFDIAPAVRLRVLRLHERG